MKYGIIAPEMANLSERRLKSAAEMCHHIDDVVEDGDYESEIAKLKSKIDEINSFPVVERTQQELRTNKTGIKFLSAFWLWLGSWRK